MKIEIENLKAQMQGFDLNIYQRADALIEFNKLLDYVNKLEQLSANEGKLHSTSMEEILKILNKYKWGATETYLTEDIITEDDFEKIANDIIDAITQ